MRLIDILIVIIVIVLIIITIIFTNTNTTLLTRRSLLPHTYHCDLNHILGHRNHTRHHHHHQNHAHSHSGHPTRLLARLPQAQERNEGHATGAADHHGLHDYGDDDNDVMMMVNLMTTVVRWMMVMVVFEKE